MKIKSLLTVFLLFSFYANANLNIVADSTTLPLDGSTATISYSHNAALPAAQCFTDAVVNNYLSPYSISPGVTARSASPGAGWGYSLSNSSGCIFSPALTSIPSIASPTGNLGLLVDFTDSTGSHTAYPSVAWSTSGTGASNAYIGAAATVSATGMQEGTTNCTLSTSLTCSYQLQDSAGHSYIIDIQWAHPMGDSHQMGIDSSSGIRTVSPNDGTTLWLAGENTDTHGAPAQSVSDYPTITAHALPLNTVSKPVAGAGLLTISYSSVDQWSHSYQYSISLDFSAINITQPTCVAIAPSVIKAEANAPGNWVATGKIGWECDAAPMADQHPGEDVVAGTAGVSRLWIAPADNKYNYVTDGQNSRRWPLSDDGLVDVSLTTADSNKDLTAPDASTWPGAVTSAAGQTQGDVTLSAQFNISKGTKPGSYSREFVAIFVVD
ncbi:hypothetical protein [Buttiauxella agrestis]|uniref:hypothetical protein n=1 Tax=Buttiauxella agrestis TaxID=82977 RepID=UPI0039761A2C